MQPTKFVDYHKEAMYILGDTDYYGKILINPFEDLNKKFGKLIQEARDKCVIMKEEYKFIHIPYPNIPI